MSDIYTPPPRTAYHLVQAFYMPSDKGDHWAIAFSGKSAVLVASALSVVVTLCFTFLWKLICFCALLFEGKESTRRRYVAMVTLWNSGDAYRALLRLLEYTFKSYPHKVKYSSKPIKPRTRSEPETAEDERDGLWADFMYGLSLCLICFAVWAGSVAMSTITSWIVLIGSVAPVNPDVLFYPDSPGSEPVQVLKDFGLRAPGVMRSLGSVEAARVTLRSRVNVATELLDMISSPGENENDIVQALHYDYNLTGVELGLRSGNDLGLGVKGYCRTEYDWYRPNESTSGRELYHLFNDAKQSWPVDLSEAAITRPPLAAFQFPDRYQTDSYPTDSNFSYAVVVSSAYRASITEGGDPWYRTELRGNLSAPRPFDAKFWMRRARPVLSCWEQMTWSYKGVNVTSVDQLRKQPNWDMPDVLLKVLEATFIAGPMIVRLGNASGDSALRSRTTSPNGVIDASASSIETDMERLVLASFVASRSLFVDATMFGSSEQRDYPNVFRAGNGKAEPGSSHFVVSSPDIQTFSLTGIVTLVAILVFLMALEALLMLLVRFHKGKTRDPKGWWSRFHVLDAVQLFRCLYEDKPYGDGYNGWNCDWPVPKMIVEEDGGNKRRFSNDICALSSCKHNYCLGHIDRRPPPAKDGKAAHTHATNRESSVTAVDNDHTARDSILRQKQPIQTPHIEEKNPVDGM
ncbi:hypothetical protein B0T20DRAFT_99533 [Sordaria brevicollis]|uniref:Uncharacterized protein n=1 Tax=Sordaria brevicollis TaxID=83679 RepID=A0AAE0NWC8_SORBR|nr:hypothetical protein B0T20DRAFT_99533 [Sordaria brevicollis]